MAQSSVRIPADVDREDTILAGFTGRQIAVMAVTALLLYGMWLATRGFLPILAYLVVAVPIGVAVSASVVVRRDGITLDRLLLAALRQRLQPTRRVAAGATAATVPDWLTDIADDGAQPATGRLELPATGVSEAGVVDLGANGLALIAACSTVNFQLRTPGEQEALVAVFGRYLHSLSAPVQLLIRAQRLDLSEQITELRHRAPGLPHPALEAAALDHADYLAHLGQQAELLRRQVLLVLREPLRSTPADSLGKRPRLTRRHERAVAQSPQPSAGVRRAAASRLLRRMREATELLSAGGIEITPLDTAQATAVLTSATNPDSLLPPSPAMANVNEVITTAGGSEWDLGVEEGTP